MRIGVALALIVATSGCAAEAQRAPLVPMAPPAGAPDPSAIEALEPLPVFRCRDEDRSCWTLARPCACPVAAPEPAAVAYLELGPGPVIDYLDLEPKRPVEYIELEATP
jgi:hypothetical protein